MSDLINLVNSNARVGVNYLLMDIKESVYGRYVGSWYIHKRNEVDWHTDLKEI